LFVPGGKDNPYVPVILEPAVVIISIHQRAQGHTEIRILRVVSKGQVNGRQTSKCLKADENQWVSRSFLNLKEMKSTESLKANRPKDAHKLPRLVARTGAVSWKEGLVIHPYTSQ